MSAKQPTLDLHDSDDLVRAIDHALGQVLVTDWRNITVTLNWTGYRHLMGLKGLDLGLWPHGRCLIAGPLRAYRGFPLKLSRNDSAEVGGDNPTRGGTSAFAIRIPAGLEHVHPAPAARKGKAAGPSWGLHEPDAVEFDHGNVV